LEYQIENAGRGDEEKKRCRFGKSMVKWWKENKLEITANAVVKRLEEASAND